ncbi:MAG: GNAT family protein [Planctomycetota bacterium]|nr:GNAT family protein [Planctomycetota bacterium]
MTETIPPIRAPYRIETQRLVLRPYAPEDVEELCDATARSKQHLLDYLPWARFEPQTLDQKLELILSFRAQFDSKSNYIYGIFDSQAGTLLGGTGLHPRLEGGAYEIGYWATPEAEGNGYVSEAARAQCRVGFDLMQLDLIGLRMETDNQRSEKVATGLGFVREGLLRRSIRFASDEPKDSLRYSMLPSEYRAQPWHKETCANVRSYDVLGRAIAFQA